MQRISTSLSLIQRANSLFDSFISLKKTSKVPFKLSTNHRKSDKNNGKKSLTTPNYQSFKKSKCSVSILEQSYLTSCKRIITLINGSFKFLSYLTDYLITIFQNTPSCISHRHPLHCFQNLHEACYTGQTPSLLPLVRDPRAQILTLHLHPLSGSNLLLFHGSTQSILTMDYPKEFLL